MWNLCSRPTHTIRVRVAEPMYNTSKAETNGVREAEAEDAVAIEREGGMGEGLSVDEKAVLDKVGEALARLGRVKRVAIGVREKVEFLRVWQKRSR